MEFMKLLILVNLNKKHLIYLTYIIAKMFIIGFVIH